MQRLVHAFTVTQKLDVIVLLAISMILKIKVVHKKTYNAATAENKSMIPFIISYFTDTIKGIKSLEFRI